MGGPPADEPLPIQQTQQIIQLIEQTAEMWPQVSLLENDEDFSASLTHVLIQISVLHQLFRDNDGYLLPPKSVS